MSASTGCGVGSSVDRVIDQKIRGQRTVMRNVRWGEAGERSWEED